MQGGRRPRMSGLPQSCSEPLAGCSMVAIVSENPGTSIAFKHHLSLPPCALDNDVLIEVGPSPAGPPLLPGGARRPVGGSLRRAAAHPRAGCVLAGQQRAAQPPTPGPSPPNPPHSPPYSSPASATR